MPNKTETSFHINKNIFDYFMTIHITSEVRHLTLKSIHVASQFHPTELFFLHSMSPSYMKMLM